MCTSCFISQKIVNIFVFCMILSLNVDYFLHCVLMVSYVSQC
jgi:hypothetical protein